MMNQIIIYEMNVVYKRNTYQIKFLCHLIDKRVGRFDVTIEDEDCVFTNTEEPQTMVINCY